jgi:hypothetical protein
MIFKLATVVVAGLLGGYVSAAQQSSSPSQQTPAQGQPAPAAAPPCNKATPSPARKPGWLETKAKALACKQNKNLCDLPSSPSDITGSTSSAKPCPANTSSNAAPASKPPAQAPATTGAPPSASTKPTYVCPPKATLIPGYAYCLLPDHSTVDAIPLPPDMKTPAAPAPNQPQPH